MHWLVSHIFYAAAEERFGLLAAQNAVTTLLVSRIIVPTLLRRSQQVSGSRAGGNPQSLGVDASAPLGGVNPRVSQLCKRLQRLAHSAHHSDRDEQAASGGGTIALTAGAQAEETHAAALFDLASHVLGTLAPQTLGLEVSPEVAEQAAEWIVAACSRWSAGPSQAGGGRTIGILAKTALPIAQLAGVESLPCRSSP